ncbi:spore germination protein GerE [Halolactibacillus miurensis]|uniref:LuxR family transcriptional regulator, transcriptional regulator of spore coat protein n=1 Tax=Halolactibacillus miurensis TaxID=306541 RepID=A0A1I6UEB0_9BACI|nr:MULTISPECIES: helix-turn-helix transcriptional regulator [Halolactibacillus]GEM05212.1 spore germination protein GerE [Halolactibacillus miurensis]SFS99750.1 LuxR family transcriptional regulator, transcriptional regulator of spore coat protein [Halolactibacillus miurensis]
MTDQYKRVLTKRERDVFQLLSEGYATADIAQSLTITEKTVRNHISNVMLKIGAKDRTQALVYLVKTNELTIN